MRSVFAKLSIAQLAYECIAIVGQITFTEKANPRRWIRRAEEMIRESFVDDLSLALIAKECGVNDAHWPEIL